MISITSWIITSGSLIFRLPIGETGLAPYAFCGGGYQFDPVDTSFLHAGAGLEYRFTHNVGIFVDGRWVWSDRDRNYGLARAGFRFCVLILPKSSKPYRHKNRRGFLVCWITEKLRK